MIVLLIEFVKSANSLQMQDIYAPLIKTPVNPSSMRFVGAIFSEAADLLGSSVHTSF